MTESNDVHGQPPNEALWALATAVRDAFYAEALAAYEDARSDGLCHGGAYECALEALRAADLQAIVTRLTAGE